MSSEAEGVLETISSTASGHFTSACRIAAIERALPLLATYAADAPSWQLVAQAQVTSVDEELNDLGGFVDMRVALAAGRALERILRSLLARASFFYSLNAEESVGAIRGQLDVARYLQTRRQRQAPRTYPVRVLYRSSVTPENILAAYCALWVLRRLQRAPMHALPPRAPERAEIVEQLSNLSGLVRQPVLAASLDRARDTYRRGQLGPLFRQVQRRLESGRTAGGDAYRDLVSWIQRFDLSHASPVVGQVEWLFYDDRFDTKLFEIWMLHLLLDALICRLGQPPAGRRPLFERSIGSIAAWNVGGAELEVWFQRALTRLGEPKWHWDTKSSEGPLEGVPDLAVTIKRLGHDTRTILVDAKLRERAVAPADELYKLLGYFANLGEPPPAYGAIIFYAPSAPRTITLEGPGDGRILAVGVDPTDNVRCNEQFDELAEMTIAAV